EYQMQVSTEIENIVRQNCHSQADNFCDTPPDYISSRWTCNETDSSNTIQKDINGNSFRSDGSLFMSYALDNCMSRFTEEQMTSMHNNLDNRRNDLDRNVSPLSFSNFDNINIFPSDSTIQKIKVIFFWNPIRNADKYIFQLARNKVFSVLTKNVIMNNNSIEVDSLIPGKRYYWRVIPLNNFDFCNEGSNHFTFTTEELTNVSNTIDKEVIVFPNPIKRFNNINIRCRDNNLNTHIRILNNTGVDCTNQIQVVRNTNNIELVSTALKGGVYFLDIQNKFYKIIILD
ncbi:MAG: T9SS type A sorting domain-containing protein, partial [Saprospiraceae bacterium]